MPSTGNVDISWPTVTAAAVRFSFSGGSAASITGLTVPNGAAANVTSTLSGARATAPGSAVTEMLTLQDVGDVDAHDVTSHLTALSVFLVNVPTSGVYPVTVRYANSLGGQHPPLQNVTRTTSLTTGATTSPTTQQLSLPVTGSWDTWSTVTATVTLPAGFDLVELSVGPDDSGSVNIDSLTIG